MARQQPVASDLRTLVTALRMSGDLERMGDLAVHLAKTARRRHPESAIPPELQATVLEMGQIAERMIAKAGSVIASQDVAMGLELDADDDQMDRLHRKLFDALLSPKWRHGVEPAVDISLAGRYFERFADHAVHVAENVVYLVTGPRPYAKKPRPRPGFLCTGPGPADLAVRSADPGGGSRTLMKSRLRPAPCPHTVRV
jgi:phosphate transport system protein